MCFSLCMCFSLYDVLLPVWCVSQLFDVFLALWCVSHGMVYFSPYSVLLTVWCVSNWHPQMDSWQCWLLVYTFRLQWNVKFQNFLSIISWPQGHAQNDRYFPAVLTYYLKISISYKYFAFYSYCENVRTVSQRWVCFPDKCSCTKFHDLLQIHKMKRGA